MALSSAQIRMARALLDWSTKDLAGKISISVNSLNKIERDITNAPRDSTMHNLEHVLGEAGVEFLPNHGVRLRDSRLQTLVGTDAYVQLIDLIATKLRDTTAPEALFSYVDDARSPPAVVSAMTELRKKIRCRYLCRVLPTRLDFPTQDYRAVPDHFFQNTPQVVFGDCVAQIIANEPLNILVIDSRVLADAARCSFEFFWAHLQQPQVRS